MKRVLTFFALLLVMLLAGCGGGGGGGTPISSQGVLIAKATGGSVSSGKCTVAIPANALAADTRIYVQPAQGTLPAAPGNLQIVGGTAYDLTPNGLTFLTPATLTIKYNPKSLAPGVPETSIELYTLVSGAWQKVSGASVDPTIHTISVPLSHFSVYAALAPQFIGSGPIYNVIDLGTLPGDAGATPYGLSSNGYVCGLSTTADGTLHAFLWKNGTMTNLGKRDGDIWAIAYGVNASGVAVGISLPDNSNAFPVKFENGKVTQLNTAFGMIAGAATAINDNGDYIVGTALARNGTITPFVGFSLTSLSGVFSGNLNNKGEVAGHAVDHAAIWRDGSVIDAGILPGYDYCEGTAISDASTMAGTASISGDDKLVGFYYDGTSMSKIAPVTGDDILIPRGVNSSGKVVGTSTAGFVTLRGFVWQNGVTTDLNTLISRQSGWTILNAYAINDQGQILAYGQNGGVQHPILLVPKS